MTRSESMPNIPFSKQIESQISKPDYEDTTGKYMITDMNAFMKKLEASDSFSSKHLKEKINVKGKWKKVNKERVIRVIQDTLNIINE